MAKLAGIESMSPEGISNFHGIEGFPAEPMILYTSVKRTLDVAISLALLVLLSPLLVITAAAIRIDSRGPILFTQERMGTRRLRQDGSTYWRLRIFRLYKFRSMTVDADSAVHELHIAAMAGQDNDANAQGVTSIKLRRDPRITRVGRYLRVTSIDELPQLINVLRGEMSLVGPRPVPLYEFARYRPEHLRRFTVLPGISGLWQVRGRCDLSFWEMVSCDLEYAEKPTFWGDLRIMLRTLPAVVSGRGAG